MRKPFFIPQNLITLVVANSNYVLPMKPIISSANYSVLTTPISSRVVVSLRTHKMDALKI